MKFYHRTFLRRNSSKLKVLIGASILIAFFQFLWFPRAVNIGDGESVGIIGNATQMHNIKLSANTHFDDPIAELVGSVDSVSHKTFAAAQKLIMRNVSLGIKLPAAIAARYMDELIIWSDLDQERNTCRDKALGFYSAAAGMEPLNSLFAYRQGVMSWHKKEFQAALGFLAECTLLAGANRTVHNDRIAARCYMFMGMCIVALKEDTEARAILALEKALNLDPTVSTIHHEYALLLYRAGKLEAAATHLHTAMCLDPYREHATALTLVNDYQGHDYVPYTNMVVFELAKVRKSIWQSAIATGTSVSAAAAAAQKQRARPNTLVFCINSGRSGSQYLASIFRTMQGDAYGFHEPMPQTHWHEHTLEKPLAESYDLRRSKADIIKKFLDTAPPGSVYTETSLNFITQFPDVVMNEFLGPKYRVSIILLRRDLVKTLKSIIDVGWFDEKMKAAGEQWDRWTHSLNSANAVLKPLGPDEALTRYEKAIGYLIDIEARAVKFRKDYPDAHVIEVNLEDLNNATYLASLASQLNMVPSQFTFDLIGHVTNLKPTSKGVAGAMANKTLSVAPMNTEAYCQQQIEVYLMKCKQKRIEVPPLPHFIPKYTTKRLNSKLAEIKSAQSKS